MICVTIILGIYAGIVVRLRLHSGCEFIPGNMVFVASVYTSGIEVKPIGCSSKLRAFAYCNEGKCPRIGVLATLQKVQARENSLSVSVSNLKVPEWNSEPWMFARYVGNSLKEEYYSLILESEGPDTANIMVSLLFGGTALPEWFKKGMEALGLQHITAISGANIALLMSFMEGVLRKLHKVLINSIMIIVSLALLTITGPLPPLLRAFFTIIIVSIFTLWGRKVEGLSYVTLPALLGIFFFPELSESKSYFLAVAAIFGVMVIAPSIERKFVKHIKRVFPRISKKFIDFCRVIILQLGVAISIQPLLWFYFGRNSPIGIVSSIILDSTFTVLLTVGYIAFIASSTFSEVTRLSFPAVKLILTVIKIMFHILENITISYQHV